MRIIKQMRNRGLDVVHIEESAFVVKEDSGWIWICQTKYLGGSFGELSGKYLFFSTRQDLLIQLAKVILVDYGLKISKVVTEDERVGNDFVLCIYDTEPKYLRQLRRFQTDTIKYRGWKSDSATRAGTYSEQFRKCQELEITLDSDVLYFTNS